MTRVATFWLTVLGVVGASGATSHEAEACSRAPDPPKLVGYPEDGATDVPTDVAPLYQIQLAGALLEKNHELVADSGEVVAVDRIPSGDAWYYAFRPRTVLEPNQRYEFRAVGSAPGDIDPRLEFTTGEGPVAGAVLAPEIHLEHYFFEQGIQSSCSPEASGTCISFDVAPGEFIETAQFHDTEGFVDTFVYLSPEPVFLNLSGVDQGTPYNCAHFRKRAANGTYSDAVVRCRDDGVLYPIRGSEDIGCTPAGFTLDGALVSLSAPDRPGGDTEEPSSHASDDGADGGCAVRSPDRAGATHSAILLLGFGALGRLLRRRGQVQAARRAASSRRLASARDADGALPPASMRDSS